MLDKAQSRPDLLLLLSLLLVILVYPVLDHGDFRRMILSVLMFAPVILATVRLSKIRRWVWPSVLLMVAAFIFSVASTFVPAPALIGTKWALLTAFFALTVVGLFSYLKNAHSVNESHLYTAVSIYLLLGMQWFALYSAIDNFYPGCNPAQRRCGDRSSKRAAVLQFGNSLDDRLRRCCPYPRRSPHAGGAGGSYGRSLRCDHGGDTSQRLQTAGQFALVATATTTSKMPDGCYVLRRGHHRVVHAIRAIGRLNQVLPHK